MKEIDWPSPFGYTIFCDDVRSEEGGKKSFVGVYAGDLIVKGVPPINLPQFWFVVRYIEEIADADLPLELRIYLPDDADDSPTFKAVIPGGRKPHETNEGDLLEAGLRHGLNFAVRVAPLKVDREGRMKVRMIRDGAIVKLGTLGVRIHPPDDLPTHSGLQKD